MMLSSVWKMYFAVCARIAARPFYEDEYRKVDGEWKIRSTGYKRLFEEMQPRADVKGLRLTASWWGQVGR